MSDQNTTPEEPTAACIVPVEEKVNMLQNWIALIQRDIDAIQLVRDKEYEVYAKQKSMYDTWLAKRYKVVTRYEKKMRERRNQIAEIETEIRSIQERPAPGILPPLPVDDTPKKSRWKRTAGVDTSSTATVTPQEPMADVIPADIVLSDEERAQLNADATGSSAL